MTGSKYSKLMRPGGWKGMIRRSHIGLQTKFDYSISSFIRLAGMSGLIIMLCRITTHGPDHGSSSSLPKTPDWDKQRTMWMDEHPSQRPQKWERSRILMVTGSLPQPYESNVTAHAMLQSAKNKLDYCRLHDIQFYYSLANPDPNLHPEFSADWWVTLPTIRMLMFRHPEVEWIWWVDADVVFTDLSLEPPFADLNHYNLLLFREDSKEKTGLHPGNYLIRNCQWSLNLIQAWGSTTRSKRADDNLSSRSDLVPEEALESKFDIHNLAVVTSLLAPQQDAGRQVKETESWMRVAPNLEELQVSRQRKQVQGVIPLVTHFAGCIPYIGPCDVVQLPSVTQQQEKSEDGCLQQLDRTFDFADNQVYGRYGFQRRALGSSKTKALTKDAEDEAFSRRFEGNDLKFSMLPRISNWDEQRRELLARLLEKSSVSITKDKMMLVSGSSPKNCARAVGDQMLLRGLKNKIDYCRLQSIEIFYNMAVVDQDFTGWWSKLPLLRLLMLNHPDVEWFWWMDSDAVVTDMNFSIPFERYNVNGGYNLVMYGKEDLLYEEKDYRAINTGSFFMRNTQWSIDLLDRWASFATTPEAMEKNGEVLSNFLQRPSKWAADDQSVLVYVLITEKERWGNKVLLENTDDWSSPTLSGSWWYWTPQFLDNVTLSVIPFVTHFAGCTPCGDKVSEKCLTEMDRTLHFADNQVLESMELCHEHLGSPVLTTSCGRPPGVII